MPFKPDLTSSTAELVEDDVSTGCEAAGWDEMVLIFSSVIGIEMRK